jgi:hypothetical protein
VKSSEMPPTSFPRRVLRAAFLHADTYEEVEADRSSLAQATLLVVLACLAAAAGAYLRRETGSSIIPAGDLPLGWHLALIGTEPLISWLLSSAFAYMVGSTFLRGPETATDYAEVLRTTGFAFGPGVLALFAGMLPATLGLGAILFSRIWVVIANIVAVRQALDFTTLRAVLTYGASVLLIWLLLWGLAVAPLPV